MRRAPALAAWAVRVAMPIGVVAIAAVGAVFVAVRRAPGAAGATPPAPSPTDAPALYLRDCASCHGPRAAGTPYGPSLQGVGRAAVDYWVSSGRMPLLASAGRPSPNPIQQPGPAALRLQSTATAARHPAAYSPAVIAAIDDYVASLAPGGPAIPQVDPARGDVATGGQLYREQCAACHAWGGDGGALLDRQAPALHQATNIQIGEAIRTGPGNMPAFGSAAIDDRDLNSVVAYVRSLDHPDDRGGNRLWDLGPVAEGGVAWLIGMGLLLLTIRWIGERG